MIADGFMGFVEKTAPAAIGLGLMWAGGVLCTWFRSTPLKEKWCTLGFVAAAIGIVIAAIDGAISIGRKWDLL